jgi:hypothetical protein
VVAVSLTYNYFFMKIILLIHRVKLKRTKQGSFLHLFLESENKSSLYAFKKDVFVEFVYSGI